MKKLIKSILTDKNVRNIAVVNALALALTIAGEPWGPETIV